MIVAIEGTDASGKATQSKLLTEKLGGTRFPFPEYTTPTGQAILGHLKREWAAMNINEIGGLIDEDKPPTGETKHLNMVVFQCLQTANRLEMLPAIRLALDAGPVVFDRWWASGVVYGTLDGLDPAWIRSIQLPMLEPDVWILLDVSVDEGFKRRPERRDRYEADRGYLEKVRASYLRLFAEEERRARGSVKWRVIDGLGSVEEVHERILEMLR